MSEKLKVQHLSRKAILYIRQSSAYQVNHNQESQNLQYVMRERLIQRKRPAVPPCRIVIYGLSGRRGKSSSIRLLGQTGNFSGVSLSQACGSRPFSLAVPNRL